MASWIGGYERLTEMKTVGSGSARWCIVRRHGQRFFMKEFLTPVYPPEDRDTALAESQRKRCEAFEAQKLRLYDALSCVIGDTLVPVLDFFRHEGRYYAISEEVPQPRVDGENLNRLTQRELREILFALAECLRRLHTQGVIHADLKPEHLLLVGGKGNRILRLIDLDSGFLEEEPPSQERDIQGDPVYLAPEAFLCLMGENTRLTCKADTFALGILIHRLWTGELPRVDTERFTYLYEAALADAEIQLSQAMPLAYRLCVQRMLRKNPEDRPSDEEVVRLFTVTKAEKAAKTDQEAPSLNGLSRFMKARG